MAEKNSIDESALLKQLIIGEDISEEMRYQASLFASIAFSAAHAEEQEARMKLALELLEADLDTGARHQLIAAGEKVREAAVESIIHKNPNWEKLFHSYLDHQLYRKILAAATEAFKQRSIMISGLGAMKRSEINQEEMHINMNPARASHALANKFKDTVAKAKKNP